MAMSRAGILYVAEGENNVIRAIDTVQGSISTIAGVGRDQHRYAGDAVAATAAPLWQPHGVCVQAGGELLISDTMNHRVRLLVQEPHPRPSKD
jgi:hypothetical protein